MAASGRNGARRLLLYVEEYGLTQFRVTTALWMLLVAVGYLLILARIHGHRPIGFLFRTNTISTALLLSATAVLDVDGLVAAAHRDRVGRSQRLL